jgi:GNAT superfamily N-acetyltransferase
MPLLSRASWGRLRLILRYGGVGMLVGHLLRRMLHPLVAWEAFSFLELNIDTMRIMDTRARIPLDIRLAGLEDRKLIESFADQSGLPPGEFEARLARRDLCFIGLSEGRLVHVFWVATVLGCIPQIAATIRLTPGESYLYESQTHETARGQGIQPAVSAYILSWGRAHGFHRAFFYINRRNMAGLRILGRIFDPPPQVVKTVRWLRIGGLKGFLLVGRDHGTDPRLELAPTVKIRDLGRLGQWIQEPPR